MFTKGMARVTASGTPSFAANSGMFSALTRNAAGDYTLTIDSEFAYDASVGFNVTPEAAVAASGSIGVGLVRVSATSIRITTAQEGVTGGASALADIDFCVVATSIRGTA